jgi:hypothetical protein
MTTGLFLVPVPRMTHNGSSATIVRPHSLTQREAESEAKRKREAEAKKKGFPVEEPGSPNCRLTKGEFFQGSRAYTPADGPFHYKADITFFLALATPAPGSETEEYVRRGVRNVPVLEPSNQLSGDEKRRLARLRRSPREPTVAELENQRKMRDFFLAQAESLG